jgi:hypothetical protein
MRRPFFGCQESRIVFQPVSGESALCVCRQAGSLDLKISRVKQRPELPDNATDEQIRQAARLLLMDKLSAGTITAAEFAQFKDIFGLTQKDADLHIQMVDFKDAV